MKPLEHAEQSQRRYGFAIETTLPIHNFLDQTKAAHADMRHRAILHNSMGPFIAEQIFGGYLTAPDGRNVSVRQIAEDHIMEDMGRIPNVAEFIGLIPVAEMHRFAYTRKTRRTLNLAD